MLTPFNALVESGDWVRGIVWDATDLGGPAVGGGPTLEAVVEEEGEGLESSASAPRRAAWFTEELSLILCLGSALQCLFSPQARRRRYPSRSLMQILPVRRRQCPSCPFTTSIRTTYPTTITTRA